MRRTVFADSTTVLVAGGGAQITFRQNRFG